MSVRRVFAGLCLFVLAATCGCLSFHQGAMPGEPKNATFVEVEGARVRYLDTDPSTAEAQKTIETDDGHEAIAGLLVGDLGLFGSGLLAHASSISGSMSKAKSLPVICT